MCKNKVQDSRNEVRNLLSNIEIGAFCKCQHRNAIKFRNENVVFLRYDYLSSGSTKS